jgi:hypothetical protein
MRSIKSAGKGQTSIQNDKTRGREPGGPHNRIPATQPPRRDAVTVLAEKSPS